MKSQRDSFIESLFNLAKNDRDIVLISADMGAPSLDQFRLELPAQFVNTGIAEQNAILIGAGLAREGKKVIVYAIASFLTLNTVEKLRVECAMMGIPLVLLGVGAGFSYPDSGPTHHLIEDITLLRALPNFTIINVTDSVMAQAASCFINERSHSTYVRLDRENLPPLYKSVDSIDFLKGMHFQKAGKNNLIISTGIMTHRALEYANSRPHLNLAVLDLFKFPINEEELSKSLADFDSIATLEEHFLPGGLGSAVLETINDQHIEAKRILRLGLDTKAGYSYRYGGRDQVLSHYQLDQSSICHKLDSFFTKKL